MRKYILFIALCLHIAARGQTIADIDLSWLPQPTQAKALRYWIDDDTDNMQTTDILNGQHTVDVSSLVNGLHTIHYQIIDSEEKVASPYSGIFLKMADNIPSLSASTLRYWFDDNTNINTCDVNAGVQLLDVSMLLDGLHTIHYQVVDKERQVSYIASDMFLKIEETTEFGNVSANKLIYWFDDETTTITIDMASGMMTIDASALTDGLHTIHYLIVCSDGSLTSPHSSIFLRMNIDIQSTTAQSLRYWFDTDTEIIVTDIAQGIQTIDASHLLDGLHTVHYQIVDDSGSVTSPVSGIFLKMPDEIKTATVQSLRYWFDNDTEVMTTNMASGTQGIDVSDLLPGLHTLHYQLVDSEGQLASPMSDIFLKMFDKPYEDGQNGITKYQYWQNNNTATVQTVTLDAAVNPYTLIALLPMQTEPLRSSCFHFEMKDGKPMMYAKNDFHIRFTDAAGYFVDDSRQFVDYSVSRDVEPVGELQATQTFPKVAENGIRWYTMQAAPGDTAAFKLSQPATVQVFAPSGAEIFKTSESASVKWGGIHTWEDGTYYLAVHDVTGRKENMTLEYMHMDKYDVVDWDVHTVGNGGCSTITFKGNGFRDLYAVDLVVAPGDTIHSFDVSHDSDAETSVTFDFTGATLGDYNAVFHFTEEDKPVANVVTVEEAVDIELATDVSFPSSFLSGTSTTYTIKITNKGNMTAYAVPLEIKLYSEQFSNISTVVFKDMNGHILDEYTDDFIKDDSIDAEDLRFFTTLNKELSGLSTFIVLKDTTSNTEVGFSDRVVTIPPKCTCTINVEVKCLSSTYLFATTPSEWYPIQISDNNDIRKIKKSSLANSKDGACCQKEKWECIVGSASDALGLIPVPLLGCIPALADLGTFTVFEIVCGNEESKLDNLKRYLANYRNNINGNQGTAWGKVVNTVLGCLGAKILAKVNDLRKKLKDLERTRKLTLTQAVNYNRLHANYIAEYDKQMRLADQLYAQGNVAEAEKIAEEAKGLKLEADNYKNWSNERYDEAERLTKEMKSVEASIEQEKLDYAQILQYLRFGLNSIINDFMCTKERLDAKQNCPPTPDGGGGKSTPYTPRDPNEIFGPLSETGSKFIADSVARVNYMIEFENDTTFATAAAHTIVIKDTLDSRYFDLTKFMPTGVRIGGHEVFLDEADVVTNNSKTTFVKTIDMRPEINAIAQVNGEFNQKNGIAQWTFTSLDPMTMEPTNDLMQGILPVNYDGTSGIGEVMFEIGVKQGKADGTELNNRAGIVFDYEEAILTPTWTNIVDAVAPSSSIDNSWMVNDSTLRITADGFDARSGVWKYVWYVQAGENAPWWKEGETNDASFDYHIYEGIDYGFCVLAVDSAGNVEQKVVQRERGFKTYGQDYEDNISPLPASHEEEKQVFDLSGRKHEEPQEGINIINRKKMLFRRKGK